MEYFLSITSAVETNALGLQTRRSLNRVLAEAELGPFAQFGSPEFFCGRLLDFSTERLYSLGDACEVEVLFRGAVYRFEGLASNGCFKLARIN